MHKIVSFTTINMYFSHHRQQTNMYSLDEICNTLVSMLVYNLLKDISRNRERNLFLADRHLERKRLDDTSTVLVWTENREQTGPLCLVSFRVSVTLLFLAALVVVVVAVAVVVTVNIHLDKRTFKPGR